MRMKLLMAIIISFCSEGCGQRFADNPPVQARLYYSSSLLPTALFWSFQFHALYLPLIFFLKHQEFYVCNLFVIH